MSQSSFPSGNRRVATSFDPQVQPVVLCRALPPLSDATLDIEFIRSAFSSPPEWQVEPVFSDSFQADFLDTQNLVQAAVLFPLVQRPSGLHVIFTRRAMHLYYHAGQISFPGGRIEASDRDAAAAALRETQEEIGVSPEFVQPIGMQPCFLTSTGFTMRPVIGVIRPGFTITPDASEVAEVFEVPLSVLMNTQLHRLHEIRQPGGEHRFYFSISWKSYFIWGATAALIRNFYHYLAAAQEKSKR